MPKQTRKQFSQVLADLANEKYPPSKEDLYAVSDLGGKQLQQFAAGWRGLSAARRLRILTEMGELADSHVEFNYHAIARAVLEDEDDKVRAAAIRNLWEDQSADLIAPFVKALTQDKSAEVRAAAASALGIYVYLGETEELPRAKAKAVEDTLLKIFGGADPVEVRRRAL
ncbi:MAG: HEAT repeat domain-containing protein, partial [Chloroflexota bacterium]